MKKWQKKKSVHWQAGTLFSKAGDEKFHPLNFIRKIVTL